MKRPEVLDFFHQDTSTITYLVWDPETSDAMIIDPVMDYDSASSTYFYNSVETVMAEIKDLGLEIQYILETHAHADHLSGSQEFKRRLVALGMTPKIVIGAEISEVQKTFKKIYNLAESFPTDGSQFDHLMVEGDELLIGSIKLRTIHTPGHTPACYSYYIGDALFTGDALFMPDYGVGRCDFPGGSAELLYESVHGKLYKLPDETRTYTAHDYQPGGREYKCESTLGEHKKSNVHLKEATTKEEFVKFRTERDAKLSAPKLLLPSIEVNVDGGRFPVPENNGVSYLKIPITPKQGSRK